jgi:uncharacterized protein with PIN domain
VTATVRFPPALRFFLPLRHRSGVCEVPLSTLGHAVEALGVPRTEMGTPLVNFEPAAFDTRLSDGDVVDVPSRPRPQWIPTPRFVLDVHLGTLARRLRLLGVDVAYRNDADDDELVAQANAEGRVLLTQDRGILRRRGLSHGAYVLGSAPDDQLADVLDRFTLSLSPFTRCPSCNGLLVEVAKDEVSDLLPDGTRRSYDQFSRCAECGRLYWRGAHSDSLESIVATATHRPQ